MPKLRATKIKGSTVSHSKDLLTPSSPEGLLTLPLMTKGFWLPWEASCLSSAVWCQYSTSLLKVKLRTVDIAPLRQTRPQKRSGMARVLNGSHSFTCTPTIAMSHTCLCLPSYSWYSFTDSGGMDGWVDLGGWLCNETVYQPKGSHPSHY